MTDGDIFEFRLYVAGDLPNSRRAIDNLQAYCQEHLPGRHRIEVLDVFEAVDRAHADKILLTPQLIVQSPGRTRHIVGDLSELDVMGQGTLKKTLL